MRAEPKVRRDLIAAMMTATVAVVACAAAANAALEIRHSPNTKYTAELTRAYQECTAPNDVSSDGIPACNPPVTSVCEYVRGSVEFDPFQNIPKLVVDLTLVHVTGPGTCPTGTYGAYFLLRISADDATCTSGQCTWIDVPIAFTLSASGSSRELHNIVFEDELLANYAVPAGHIANYQILGVTIIAPDGKPIASAGVGNHSANLVRSDVTTHYGECTTPDTANAGGVPACSAPVWGAHCDFTAGEIVVEDATGASTPTVAGRFSGLSGASPLCADGTYLIESRLRATGSVCSGSPCTLVDTIATTSLLAVDGELSGEGFDPAITGLFDTVEVLETILRDPLGEPIATVGVTNAHLLSEPNIKIAFKDVLSPLDDRLTIRAGLAQKSSTPQIDPTIDGATIAVTDQNGPVYSVTIPAGSWQILKPGEKWQYKDSTGSLAGVRKVTLKRINSGNTPAGYKFKLTARDLDLSAADLPSVNLSFTAANTGGSDTIGMRNAPCAVKPKTVRCHY